jgi:hypothetical protein
MNEIGLYDGYWRFILKIPRDDPMGFWLNGRAGNPNRESAHNIKEYLGDVFAGAMSEILRENGISYECVSEKIYPGDHDYNPDMPFAKENGYHFGRTHYEYAGESQERQVCIRLG